MTQQKRIIEYTKENGFITSRHASQIEIMDLQGQIKALERKGFVWEHIWDESGKFKKYYLVSEPNKVAA